jgi:hypothetical protein
MAEERPLIGRIRRAAAVVGGISAGAVALGLVEATRFGARDWLTGFETALGAAGVAVALWLLLRGEQAFEALGAAAEPTSLLSPAAVGAGRGSGSSRRRTPRSVESADSGSGPVPSPPRAPSTTARPASGAPAAIALQPPARAAAPDIDGLVPIPAPRGSAGLPARTSSPGERAPADRGSRFTSRELDQIFRELDTISERLETRGRGTRAASTRED